MSNKVGDNTPSHEEILALLAQLREVVTRLKTLGITLDTYDRKRLGRPRTGADEHVRKVVELARKYGVAIPGNPLTGVENDLRLASELEPFETELQGAAQLVADTQAQAASEYWDAFLAYYGALAAMARNIPELTVELQSVVDFMAIGKRKGAEPRPV